MQNNIYEYGCELVQEESNYIYKSYEFLIKKLKELNMYTNETSEKSKKNAKIIGSMVAELFKERISYILHKNNLGNIYKISENNVYVEGCHIEFDFLILKKSAKKLTIHDKSNNEIVYELPIYNPSDVIAVLESKTYGIYTLYKGRDTNANINEELKKHSLYLFVNAYTTLLNYNNNIKLGYICLTEQRPKNGVSNFIQKTIYFFEDYFKQVGNNLKDTNIQTAESWFVYFAKCQFSSKQPSLYSNENELENFVLNLVKQHQ